MAVPALVSGSVQFQMGSDFVVTAPYSRIMIIVVTVLLMIALSLFIKYSRIGRASRACSQDLRMANLLGIDTNRIISFTFIIGAMLAAVRSEEHTSELQSLMRISHAVFCLKKKKTIQY